MSKEVFCGFFEFIFGDMKMEVIFNRKLRFRMDCSFFYYFKIISKILFKDWFLLYFGNLERVYFVFVGKERREIKSCFL